jgi:agmatinase
LTKRKREDHGELAERAAGLRGPVAKGGLGLAPVAPARDLGGISCITAGRLAANLIGATMRAGYFERP